MGKSMLYQMNCEKSCQRSVDVMEWRNRHFQAQGYNPPALLENGIKSCEGPQHPMKSQSLLGIVEEIEPRPKRTSPQSIV